MTSVATKDIIVIGGSAGSGAVLRQVLRDLPADLPASVFISTHIPSHMPRDRKSTRLNSSHSGESRMPSSA